MYEYIRGIYSGINKDYVVIDNDKIGYRIFTSGNTMANMPDINEEVLLYLEQIVREDFIGLYGFLTKEELEMFKLLLSINGVGAKAALSLLSIANVKNLKFAIISNDYKLLTRAPGVGNKTAQRIVLELKDKISSEEITGVDVEESVEIMSVENENVIQQGIQALVSLGYTEREAKKAINNIDKSQNLEEIIKNSLKFLLNS